MAGTRAADTTSVVVAIERLTSHVEKFVDGPRGGVADRLRVVELIIVGHQYFVNTRLLHGGHMVLCPYVVFAGDLKPIK